MPSPAVNASVGLSGLMISNNFWLKVGPNEFIHNCIEI